MISCRHKNRNLKTANSSIFFLCVCLLELYIPVKYTIEFPRNWFLALFLVLGMSLATRCCSSLFSFNRLCFHGFNKSSGSCHSTTGSEQLVPAGCVFSLEFYHIISHTLLKKCSFREYKKFFSSFYFDTLSKFSCLFFSPNLQLL